MLNTDDNSTIFKVMAPFQRANFLENLSIFSQIYPLTLRSQQKTHAVLRRDNFHIDFKNLIYSVVAI